MTTDTSSQPIAWGGPADPKQDHWRELWATGGALAVVVIGALVAAGMYSYIIDKEEWMPLVVGAAFVVPILAVAWSLYCEHQIKRALCRGRAH